MKIDFTKNADGLVPAVIQDYVTQTVLMLGYMNQEAYQKTIDSQKVTFYSRTKKRLWTKGEESGNYLQPVTIKNDCDQDTLLIKVIPSGPVCHTGSATCWNEENKTQYGFLSELEEIISRRKQAFKTEESYIALLFEKGIHKIAQKVGEEAVEVVIEAMNKNDELFLNESADLLFHYLIVLQAKGYRLEDVVEILKQRKK